MTLKHDRRTSLASVRRFEIRKETRMPYKRADDFSPGDARAPYSDIGGPQAKHAQTHDVRREQLTNPTGPEPEDPTFAEQLAPEKTGKPVNYADESYVAADDKSMVDKLPELSDADLDRLPVLKTGTKLEQGSTYFDLNDRGRGPFKALGGHEAGPRQRLIAKSEVDYLTWNRLVGDDRNVNIERPVEAS
jgi:hypothetical protein